MFAWRAPAAWLTVIFFVGLTAFSGANAATTPNSRIVRVFGDKVRIVLPRLAADPVRLTDNLYRVQPQSDRPDLKYVIFIARETLRDDEKPLPNKQLADSVKKTLQALGYQIIKMINTGNTFVVDFRAVAEVPWQTFSPGIARGTAKFVRTGNELSGSILLCDPPQWKDKTTQSFRNVIGSTTVSRK